MSSEAPLARIVGALDRAGIPHMLAGSFASSYHGDPRTTNDIDLVIAPTLESLVSFVRSLDAGSYYVDEATARDAFRRRGQFNVVMLESGWKVDLILRQERPFSHSEFDRRPAGSIGDARVFVATAEDTIVAKLERARLGESERQLWDVAGILNVRGSDLGLSYIARWVDELELRSEWERAQLLARSRE